MAEDSPINALLLKFADQNVFNDRFFLNPKQFLRLKKDVNAALKESPNDENILTAVTSFRNAMDLDLGSLADAGVQKQMKQQL